MAELRQNTWSLNDWYEQDYAGNVDYRAPSGVVAGLWGYGSNNYGGLSQNSTAVAAYSSPIQIHETTTWNFPPSGSSHSAQSFVLTKTNGTLWSWGYNYNTVLGQNSPEGTHLSSPTQVGSDTNWASAVMGRQNSFGIKTDGTLWTWGRNIYGVLGLNQVAYPYPSSQRYSSPVQIPGTTWSKIYQSGMSIYAIKTNNTLWAWGYNGNGQLGQNERNVQYSSPVQIPGTNWAHAYSGSEMKVHATKTDGTLWSWGKGYAGGLGLGVGYPSTGYMQSSPAQVPGTDWDISAHDKIANGDRNVYAIKTDGSMWVWGSDTYGQLGLNTNAGGVNFGGQSSPVQLPGNWKSVSATYGYCVSATKTDGTTWQWARNTASVGGAYYGDNVPQSTNRSSPVQLSGSWGKVLVTRRNVILEKLN